MIQDDDRNLHDWLPQCEYVDIRAAQPGDVNIDGKVTVTDITSMVSYVLGTPKSMLNTRGGDVNGDGTITVTDITYVVSMILRQ